MPEVRNRPCLTYTGPHPPHAYAGPRYLYRCPGVEAVNLDPDAVNGIPSYVPAPLHIRARHESRR